MKKIRLQSSHSVTKGRASPITVAIFVLLVIYAIVLIVPVISFLKLFFSRDVRRVRRRFKELGEMKKKEV